MVKYHKYLNYIVNGDEELVTVGINTSPGVAEALFHGDELTWQAYLRIIHDSVSEYNKYLSDLPQDSEA